MQTVRGLAITQLWRHPGKQACDLRCGGQNLCQSQPTIHIPMEPVTRTTKNKTLACPWLVIAEKNTNQHQLVCSQYLRDGEANRKNKKKKNTPPSLALALKKVEATPTQAYLHTRYPANWKPHNLAVGTKSGASEPRRQKQRIWSWDQSTSTPDILSSNPTKVMVPVSLPLTSSRKVDLYREAYSTPIEDAVIQRPQNVRSNVCRRALGSASDAEDLMSLTM